MQAFEDLKITRKFAVISRRLRQMYDETFAQLGITGAQAALLHFIDQQDESSPICQRDIEAEFHIRRSSVSILLRGLEEKGYIQRVPVPGDSRLKALLLTSKAAALTEQLSLRTHEINSLVAAGLSSAEQRNLEALLAKLMENLAAQTGD